MSPRDKFVRRIERLGRGGAGREVEFAICNLCFATYLAQSQLLTTTTAPGYLDFYKLTVLLLIFRDC